MKAALVNYPQSITPEGELIIERPSHGSLEHAMTDYDAAETIQSIGYQAWSNSGWVQEIAADLREQEEHLKWIEAYQAGDLLLVDEMGLPTFLFNDPPYFVLEKQTGQNIPMKGKLFGGEPDKSDMKGD